MHGVDLSVLELFITELTTMVALLKSSKRLGFVILFCLLFTKNSPGFTVSE